MKEKAVSLIVICKDVLQSKSEISALKMMEIDVFTLVPPSVQAWIIGCFTTVYKMIWN